MAEILGLQLQNKKVPSHLESEWVWMTKKGLASFQQEKLMRIVSISVD